MTNENLKSKIKWCIALTLIFNTFFLVKDISDDVKEGAGFWHIGPEVFVVLGTVVTAILALVFVLRIKIRSDGFASQVRVLESANQDWQKRTKVFSEGLANEIDKQMVRWDLSVAEKEIALLMLKGLSNREIAAARNTSEHTIKQQSSAIYRKSGMGNRAELSAFFLEDLLAPQFGSAQPTSSSLL